MPEKVARLHIEDVPGYGSYARCYEVTPAIFVGGLGYKYLTVVVHPERPHVDAEVVVIYANAQGLPADLSVKRRSGSFTPIGDPHAAGQHYIDGCFVWAVAANGYKIAGYGDRKLPGGLDYDPDDTSMLDE